MKPVLQCLAVICAMVFSFVLGRLTTPSPEAEIRQGEGAWIELWRDGELVSEWQSSDGEIYRCLDEALKFMSPIPSTNVSGDLPGA